MDSTTTVGIAGATLILVAFLGGQFGKLKATSFSYDLINLVGSALLIWYGVLLAAWPFVVLNTVWATVSLKDVIYALAGDPDPNL